MKQDLSRVYVVNIDGEERVWDTLVAARQFAQYVGVSVVHGAFLLLNSSKFRYNGERYAVN